MNFYPVYLYPANSGRRFARVGSIKGYTGPFGSWTYLSLLQEAMKIFARSEGDVILLGPSPVSSLDCS